MTEAVSSSSDAAADRAAEQARLRKERREAKIKAGGSARLNKINGMGGRVVGDNDQAKPAAPTETDSSTTTTTTQRTASAADADPDEVDISEHFYSPAANRRAGAAGAMPSPPAGGFPGLPPDMTEAQLRQMMLAGGPGGPGGPGGMPGGEEDPFMKMMSQMMGGGAGGAGGFPGMPGMGGAGGAGADAASPLASMMGGQQPQASGPDVYGTIWRIMHALLAIGLGLYIVLLTPFNGTKLQRELAFKQAVEEKSSSSSSGDDFYGDAAVAGGGGGSLAELEQTKRNFFWAFATAEAVLLTTKFFLDKGRAPPTGFIWSIAGGLPQPWRGYVTNVMRYGQIFTTVRTDILLCAFVLGVCAWWKGQL